MPWLKIEGPQAARKGGNKVAGTKINTRLRRVTNAKFTEFDDPFRSHKTSDLGGFRPQAQAHVHRNIGVFEEHGMDVGSIAPVLPAVYAAEGRHAFGNFVDAEDALHAADEVHEQITGDAGAVFLPAAPTRTQQLVERPIR